MKKLTCKECGKSYSEKKASRTWKGCCPACAKKHTAALSRMNKRLSGLFGM